MSQEIERISSEEFKAVIHSETESQLIDTQSLLINSHEITSNTFYGFTSWRAYDRFKAAYSHLADSNSFNWLRYVSSNWDLA